MISDWLATIFLWGYVVIIIMAVIVVVRENRNPIRALAWVIALLFLPGVGLIFYLFFGRSLKGYQMISRRNKRKLLREQSPVKVNISEVDISGDSRSIARLAHSLSRFAYTSGNDIKIFTDGKSKFESLKRDLESAKDSIYLQYYIFKGDHIGQEIADILKRKAREGVDVKVIYDHVGSFSWSSKFFDDMKSAGVDTHPFFKVTFPQLANRINWRNHRKIVVIDGKTGYIGGMNIADRYLDGSNRIPVLKQAAQRLIAIKGTTTLKNIESHAPVEECDTNVWRDTHFRVEGDVVESLLYSFAVDWNFLKKKTDMVYKVAPHEHVNNNVGVQYVTNGPTDQWNNLTLIFLKAIASAKTRIWIQTPYFLPTDALLQALQGAALSKIDVRIMIPKKTDSVMLHYASFSYMTQCLKAGIKVYLYKPGMLHAKSMLVDDYFVTAGSTNFDFRSFENNFEGNLLIYDKGINKEMRDIFYLDQQECEKLSLKEWKKRPLPQRIFESILRLVSPLL